MENAKTPSIFGKNSEKLFKEIKELAGSDKKGDFKQERMFGRVAKIPIANNFNELAEMDFVDYGGQATFLHIRDTCSRFPAITFTGNKEKGRTNGRNGERNVISEWISFFFGTPEIGGRLSCLTNSRH